MQHNHDLVILFVSSYFLQINVNCSIDYKDEVLSWSELPDDLQHAIASVFVRHRDQVELNNWLLWQVWIGFSLVFVVYLVRLNIFVIHLNSLRRQVLQHERMHSSQLVHVLLQDLPNFIDRQVAFLFDFIHDLVGHRVAVR